jgi:hypothetical protein
MKYRVASLFSSILILVFSCSLNAQASTEYPDVEAISKVNSEQQQFLLKITDRVQSYQRNISEQYFDSLDQLPENNVPVSLVNSIVEYANEVPIVNVLELNVSYILDLTQNVFSICRLSHLIKNNAESRAEYSKYLSKQIGFLNEELEEKISWLITVTEHYKSEANAQALDISQSTKDTFILMNQYYKNLPKTGSVQ